MSKDKHLQKHEQQEQLSFAPPDVGTDSVGAPLATPTETTTNSKEPSPHEGGGRGTLIAIAQELAAAEEALLISGGEDAGQGLIERYSATQLTTERKVQACHAVCERMLSIAEEQERQAQMHLAIAKAARSVQEGIYRNIKEALAVLGRDELCGETVRFKRVTTKPIVRIENEDQISLEYYKEEVKRVPDKKAIAIAWAEGKPVPGTSYQPGSQLRTYTVQPGARKDTGESK